MNNNNISTNNDASSLNSTLCTPEQQVGQPINSQTVVKKRMRQQTVTVDNQNTKEVEAVFNRVLAIPDLQNPIDELRRQMQKLFIQKENEWTYKLNECNQKENEQLTLHKIKLRSTIPLLSRIDEFIRHMNTTGIKMIQRNGSSGSLILNSDAANGGVNSPSSAARTFSPEHVTEITKDRDSLREEVAQLENSYSDLFKRYEKMRENCVLLKNSEEELKNLLEESTTKYDRLLARFQELRNSATEQLNQANLEIQRIIKQHEENTLGLRCRLKMNEKQIQTFNLTLQGKDTQIDELKTMVEELVQKNGIMNDGEDDPADGTFCYE